MDTLADLDLWCLLLAHACQLADVRQGPLNHCAPLTQVEQRVEQQVETLEQDGERKEAETHAPV